MIIIGMTTYNNLWVGIYILLECSSYGIKAGYKMHNLIIQQGLPLNCDTYSTNL